MPWKVAEALVGFLDQICRRERSRLQVAVTGGEPMTVPDLSRYLTLWRRRGTDIAVCTTGAIEVGQQYWHTLAACGLTTVRLSLHTGSDKAAKLSFGSKYELRTVEENLSAMCRSGIEVHANFLLSRTSMQDIRAVVRFCKERGVSRIRMLGLARQGRAAENWDTLSVTRDEELTAVEELMVACEAHNLKCEFAGIHGRCTHSDSGGRCLGGTSFFHVNVNGDVFPCPAMKSKKEYRIGSVIGPVVQSRSAESSYECTCEAQGDVGVALQDDSKYLY